MECFKCTGGCGIYVAKQKKAIGSTNLGVVLHFEHSSAAVEFAKC